MKRLSMIGCSYDDYLCEQLKRKEVFVDYFDVNSRTEIDLNCQLLLLDLRGSSSVDWANSLIKSLDKNALILVLIERQQLKSPAIPVLIGQHAWDYHTAPFEIDRLMRLLGHAMGIIRIKQQCTEKLKLSYEAPVGSVNSAVMQALDKQVKRAAPTEIPILIRGESGTGKELVARRVHQQSSRANGPFIAVNCGSLTSGVVQSELFGHEKGSFTGAVTQHKGKIAQADGGTLFLDEIGDLPLEQQVNLLRFLQEGTFDLVGGHAPCSANVRIVAATHIDLDVAIERGEFRLDLFYRLNGLTVLVPSLRERKEDIIELAMQFCQQYAGEYGVESCQFSPGAKQAMLEHSWSGNVRELINRIRRAVLLCEDGLIKSVDLELKQSIVQPEFAQGLKCIKNSVEKKALLSAIERHEGKMAIVASDLQISRATLYRLIDKHEL